MTLRNVLFAIFVLIIIGLVAWVNADALDFKLVALGIGAIALIGGFIKIDQIEEFVKTKLGLASTKNDSNPK